LPFICYLTECLLALKETISLPFDLMQFDDHKEYKEQTPNRNIQKCIACTEYSLCERKDQ